MKIAVCSLLFASNPNVKPILHRSASMSASQSNHRSTLVAIFAVTVVVAGFPVAGNADPIEFTYTGTATGSINAVPFTKAGFTIVAGGDTDNRVMLASKRYIPNDWASITISGLGTYHLTSSTNTFFYPWNNGVGFVRDTGLDLYDGNNSPALADWDMLTSIGPATGDMYLLQWTAEHDPVMTDRGRLLINGGSCVGTFQATVPEPCTLALLGIGGFLVCVWKRWLV